MLFAEEGIVYLLSAVGCTFNIIIGMQEHITAWCAVGWFMAGHLSIVALAILLSRVRVWQEESLVLNITLSVMFEFFDCQPLGAVIFCISSWISILVPLSQFRDHKNIEFAACVLACNIAVVANYLIPAFLFIHRHMVRERLERQYAEIADEIERSSVDISQVTFAYDGCELCCDIEQAIECGKCLCAICLDTMKNCQVTSAFRCTHLFHASCIEGNERKSHTSVCPSCRSSPR